MSAPRVALAGSEPIVTIVGAPSITKADLEHWVSIIRGFEASQSTVNGKRVKKPPAPQPPYYSACIARLKRVTPPAERGGLKSKCEAEYVQLERKALGFLITTDWVRGEAARLHLAASHSEVMAQLHSELKGKYSLHSSQTRGLLAYTGETMGDLAFRTEGELLRSRITESVTKGKTVTTEAKVLLSDYQEAFQARWKSLTNCRPGYVIEDCMQYKTQALPPAVTPQQKEERTYRAELHERKELEQKEAKHENITAIPNVGKSRPVRSPGESYNTVGGMNLTSPAFELNGQIPLAYTCEGVGISPPMHWARIPSEAKSLLLYMIDDTQDSFTNPNGGVRWMLANINPESTGMAAGQIPEGAVVGKGNDGKTGYGPVCPEKGKTDQISFVMYAFKERLNVKPGFTEHEALAQYGANNSQMVKDKEYATFYATYTRP